MDPMEMDPPSPPPTSSLPLAPPPSSPPSQPPSSPQTATDPTTTSTSASPPPLNTLCPICNSLATTHNCLSCGLVRYCSSSCQVYDHECHSAICSQFLTSKRPDSSTDVRAFWFPADSDSTRIVWLPIQTAEDGIDDLLEDGLRGLWADEVANVSFGTKMVSQNIQRLRNLNTEIMLVFNQSTEENFMRDADTESVGSSQCSGCSQCGSDSSNGTHGRRDPQNKAVAKLMAGEGADVNWKGGVLAVGYRYGEAQEIQKRPLKLVDLEVAMFRNVVDALAVRKPLGNDLPREELAVDVESLPFGEKVRVQVLKCVRSQIGNGETMGKSLSLSTTQLAAIRENGPFEQLKLGTMIRMPLKMYRFTSLVKRVEEHWPCHDAQNPCEALLAIGVLRWDGMNPTSEFLGFPHKDCVGQTFFLRDDGKPLTWYQLDALTYFAKTISGGFNDAFQGSDTASQRRDWGNEALLMANEAGYRNEFQQMKEQMIAQGDNDWIDAEPY